MKISRLLLTIIVCLGFASLSSAGKDQENRNKATTESSKIFSSDEVDKKPEVVKAEYPTPRRGLMSADTYVTILVGIDGIVEQVELAKSSDEEYGRQALEAAKKYKFKPAMKSGRPVRCVVILPLGFTSRIRTEIR